jgi:tetratricopeptide (TPR) repeat protein
MKLSLVGAVLFLSLSAESYCGAPAMPDFPGDRAFQAMEYSVALRAYDSVTTVEPRQAAAYWRLARVQVCIADTLPHAEQEAYYRAAVENARRCIAEDSAIAEGHSWLAAALGNLAMYEGSRRKVQLCDTIKDELETAIRLNPDDYLAYSILGSFYRALGNVSWFERMLAGMLYGSVPRGGFAEGEVALKKAIAIAPEVMRNHFELGMLYRDWGKGRESRAEFELAAQCPLLVARDRKTRERARFLAAERSE